MFPQLGAAGNTYAKSVAPSVIRPGALPDPALVFDSVMKRTEYKQHPNNVSSILWYWASIVIHGKSFCLVDIWRSCLSCAFGAGR